MRSAKKMRKKNKNMNEGNMVGGDGLEPPTLSV